MVLTNVTGWNELLNGNIVAAVYNGYNTPIGGYLLLILFVVLTAILITRTTVETSFILGILFFATFNSWLNDTSFYLIIAFLAAQLGGVFYKFLVKS